jgi:hypothetical protein
MAKQKKTEPRWTVADAVNAYVAELPCWADHAPPLIAALGSRPLNAVQWEDVDQFLDGLGMSVSETNQMRTFFGHVYTHAARLEKFFGANPVWKTCKRRIPEPINWAAVHALERALLGPHPKD